MCRLVPGRGTDHDHAGTEEGDLWVDCRQLRQEVEAPCSAVVADHDDDGQALEREVHLIAGVRLDCDGR